MKSSIVASRGSNRTDLASVAAAVVTWGTLAGCALVLLGCASEPDHSAGASGGRYFDPKLGVWASPRLVGDGESVPHGGGGYLVGRPYVIGGQTYYPNPEPKGYTVVGTASWYGDAFHGRRTANGEIFDKGSITAAHPTLPLPSYVRVTNLKNSRSMIVRVNDRGPYHGGRVMDVSQRVAEALSFKGEGTARIRVDYIGRASLSGSDDDKLMATLQVDGAAAQFADASLGPEVSQPVQPAPLPRSPPPPQPVLVAARFSRGDVTHPPPLLAPPPEPRHPLPLPQTPGRWPASLKVAVAPDTAAQHGKSGAPAPATLAFERTHGSRAPARSPRPLSRPHSAGPNRGHAAEVAPEAD